MTILPPLLALIFDLLASRMHQVNSGYCGVLLTRWLKADAGDLATIRRAMEERFRSSIETMTALLHQVRDAQA